jgi:glycine oxidase
VIAKALPVCQDAFLYNPSVKTWDVIIIGAGIIGLSLAISLRKQGLRVLVVERGEPGREASYAAAGMLAPGGTETPPALRSLAAESARRYPEFVHELEDESGMKVDFREHGTILLSSNSDFPTAAEALSLDDLHSFEPELAIERICSQNLRAVLMDERSVDPRLLTAAAIKAARHREVDISSGTEVKCVFVSGDRAIGVQTERTSYSAGTVVNCAGAWAGTVPPHQFPVRPVKGQMLAVVQGPALRHVVRSDKVYVVPRSDGRLVIGSTLENTDYNKDINVNTIQSLFQAAVELLPGLEKSKKHDAWAGLRPGTPDHLPILGETSTRKYFAASGHYRDGILLAPITADAMTSVILDRTLGFDLANFSPLRFE